MGDVKITVSMFDQFTVTKEKRILNYKTIRSRKLLCLLAYILLNYDRELTAGELCEVLWEEEESDNQIGALKNLIYRLRKKLNSALGTDDYILTGMRTYYWNPKFAVQGDWMQFEQLCMDTKEYEETNKKIEIKKYTDIKKNTEIKKYTDIQKHIEATGYAETGEIENKSKNIDLMSRAIKLYQGPLLPYLGEEHWVMSRQIYEQSLYLDQVKQLAQFYEEKADWTKMEMLCRQGLKMEPLDENLYQMLLNSLLQQGKRNMLLIQYKQVQKIMQENLGVEPSQSIRQLYHQARQEVLP